MVPNYNSFYKNLANQTLEWLPMDTAELYVKNLAHNREKLELNGWIDKKITYQFNSQGFRCAEFSEEPSIMCLGCSFTIGIGLPIETIWPELIAKQLKMQCANFGIGGSSPDTAFRLCHGYIDKIKPKIVIFMVPPSIRCEFVAENNISNIIVSTDDKQHQDFFKLWASDDNNDYFNREKNILGIKMLCMERNIKFILTEAKELINLSSHLRARDLVHRGADAHQNISKVLLERI